MNVEVVKFKKLLEWFVMQLKINNDVVPGVKVSGQGYKGQKIRDCYEQWRKYDNFVFHWFGYLNRNLLDC